MASTSPLSRMTGCCSSMSSSMPGATAIRRQTEPPAAAPSTGREPAEQRAADPAPAGARRLEQGQPVGARHGRAQGGRHPPLDQVAGEAGELLAHRLERRALHLPQLDGEHLEQVAVRVDRRGAPPVGRAHQPARHVEADGPLARPRPGGGVHRHHARGVEQSGGEGGEVAQAPGSEAAVLPQGGEGVGWSRDGEARGHPPFRLRWACGAGAVSVERTADPNASSVNGFTSRGHWRSSVGPVGPERPGIAGHEQDPARQPRPAPQERDREGVARHLGQVDVEHDQVVVGGVQQLVGEVGVAHGRPLRTPGCGARAPASGGAPARRPPPGCGRS